MSQLSVKKLRNKINFDTKREICRYAQTHPELAQKDLILHFKHLNIARSTMSDILKSGGNKDGSGYRELQRVTGCVNQLLNTLRSRVPTLDTTNDEFINAEENEAVGDRMSDRDIYDYVLSENDEGQQEEQQEDAPIVRSVDPKAASQSFEDLLVPLLESCGTEADIDLIVSLRARLEEIRGLR